MSTAAGRVDGLLGQVDVVEADLAGQRGDQVGLGDQIHVDEDAAERFARLSCSARAAVSDSSVRRPASTKSARVAYVPTWVLVLSAPRGSRMSPSGPIPANGQGASREGTPEGGGADRPVQRLPADRPLPGAGRCRRISACSGPDGREELEQQAPVDGFVETVQLHPRACARPRPPAWRRGVVQPR